MRRRHFRLPSGVAGFIRFALCGDLFADFIAERPSARETSAKGFNKSFVALTPFGLGGSLRGIWQGWRMGQPEPNEQ